MTQPEVGEKEFRAKDVGLRQKDKGIEDLWLWLEGAELWIDDWGLTIKIRRLTMEDFTKTHSSHKFFFLYHLSQIMLDSVHSKQYTVSSTQHTVHLPSTQITDHRTQNTTLSTLYTWHGTYWIVHNSQYIKYTIHWTRALFSPGEWGDSPQELFKSHRKYWPTPR